MLLPYSNTNPNSDPDPDLALILTLNRYHDFSNNRSRFENDADGSIQVEDYTIQKSMAVVLNKTDGKEYYSPHNPNHNPNHDPNRWELGLPLTRIDGKEYCHSYCPIDDYDNMSPGVEYWLDSSAKDMGKVTYVRTVLSCTPMLNTDATWQGYRRRCSGRGMDLDGVLAKSSSNAPLHVLCTFCGGEVGAFGAA